MPTFSIVVPIYNVEKYIRQCLESIQNQTYKDFEVLCIDDCGTDNSIKIAEEFAQKDSRFKIFHHDHNRGVSAARNTALDNAKGKYMASVDPDDWVEKDFLKEIYNAFKICPQADAVWVNSSNYNNQTGEIKLKNPEKNEGLLLGLNGANIHQLVGTIWDKVFKTNNIKAINYRFPEGLIVEDDDFSFSYFINYQFVYRVNKSLYIYRDDREGSYTTSDTSGKRIKDQLKILYKMYCYAQKQDVVDKYKKFFLNKIADTATCVLLYKDNKINIMKDVRTILEKINFPKDFENLDNNI